MKIRLWHKILFIVAALILIMLLVQGVLSGGMVLEMLEKKVVLSLSRESGSKIQLIAGLVRESEDDLTMLGAHRDVENYFTFHAFEEQDGMVDALSNLELFFIKVHEVKTKYDRLQLLVGDKTGPVLQLNHGKVVHRYDDYDPDGGLRKLAREQGRIVHRVGRGEEGELVLISIKGIQVKDRVDGYLLLRHSFLAPVQMIMRELAGGGITAVLRDGLDNPLAFTPDFNPDLADLFQHEGSTSRWITVKNTLPSLELTLVVGMPRSEAFTVFRNMFIAGLVSAIFLVAVGFYFVRKAMHTLRQYNHILELQVAQRTIQLERANEEIRQLNENLKLENIRMGTELAIAQQIQQMVLPRHEELTSINGLDVAAFMEPASEVGGDYYDILQGQDGRITIGIGDVTGHGLESGVVMLMTQSVVRTLITHEEYPGRDRLDLLNRTLSGNIKRMGSDKNMTILLLDYVPCESTREKLPGQGAAVLRISGQHESVIVIRTDGKLEIFDTMDLGFPIGMLEDISLFVQESLIPLEQGDVVVLYTDGITEAANKSDELYGLDRLCQVVVRHRDDSAEAIQLAVVADVKQHIGTQILFDDLTLIVLKQK